jgi:branched-chain amino acid transport system substrate-binding protein
MHYNESSAQKVSRSVSPNASYDAFYVLAYAAYAGSEASVTGPTLARGVARLVPPGVPIEVGPTQALEAIATLQRGGNIDLEGATGKLDFDLARGEAPVDFAVLCMAPPEKDRGAENVESGATYDATTKDLRGALACP